MNKFNHPKYFSSVGKLGGEFLEVYKSIKEKDDIFFKNFSAVSIVANFNVIREVLIWLLKNTYYRPIYLNLESPEFTKDNEDFLLKIDLDGNLYVERCEENKEYLKQMSTFVFSHIDVKDEWIDVNMKASLGNCFTFFSTYKYPSENVNRTTSHTLSQSDQSDCDAEYDTPYHSFSLTTKDGTIFSYCTNEALFTSEIVKIALKMMEKTN